MAKSNLNSKPDHQMMSFGQYGSRLIGTGETGESDEVYKAVTGLSSTVIELTQQKGDTTLSITLETGVTVYGLFTAISVTSGQALAYIG